MPATDDANTSPTALMPGECQTPSAMSYLELPALPTAPFWARQHTQAALDAWQLPADTIRIAQHIVSELITDSLQATGSGLASSTEPDPGNAGGITLTLRLLPGRIVIEVFDTHPSPPVLADADPDAETGRGLILVQALSKEWGHYCPPAGGKTVYAVISVTDPSAHRPARCDAAPAPDAEAPWVA